MIQELLLAETLIEQRNTLGLVTLIIAAYGTIFWKFKFLRHPRCRYLIAFPGAIALILFPLSFQEVIPIFVALAGLFLSGAMAFVLCMRDSKIFWPCTTVLKRVFSDLHALQIDSAQKQLEHSKWLFFTPLERLHYKLIEAELTAVSENPRKAYESLTAIDETLLFENERHLLKLKCARYALQLKNPKQVRLFLEKTSPSNEDMRLEKALLWSWYLENQGRLREASETLHEEQLNNSNSNDQLILCKIYNNLGRLRAVEKSFSSSLKYYENAAEIASTMKYKDMIHVSYQNIIHNYGFLGQFDASSAWLQSYRKLIDWDNPYDLIEWFNLLLEYHRQRNDISTVTQIVQAHKKQLAKKVPENKLLCFDICELQILVNSHGHYMDQLYQAETQYEHYLQMDLQERYRALKEIHTATQAACNSGLQIEFRNFHQRVVRDLVGMRNEIHEHYISLPEYCVGESCYWIKELAVSEKLDYYCGSFARVIQLLSDAKKRFFEFENKIDALLINLDICDEAVYRKDLGTAKKYLQITLDELKAFQGHPIEKDCFIRIAYYYYKLKDPQNAKKYLEMFDKDGISIYHYPSWIQAYYHYLIEQLKADDRLGK